jgi:hypothetical protein
MPRRGREGVTLGHPLGVMIEGATAVVGQQVEAKTVGMDPAQNVAHES